jgi:hypothetical protein
MFNGKNTRVFQKNNSSNNEEGYSPGFKLSRFETSTDTLVFMLLCIGLAVSLALSVLFLAEKDTVVLKFIEEKSIGYNSIKKFLSFFSVSINSITYSVYNVMDLYLFVISLTTTMKGQNTNVEGTQVMLRDTQMPESHMAADSMGRRGFTMINSESGQEQLPSMSNVPAHQTSSNQ